MSGDHKFLPGELKLLPCPFCGGEAEDRRFYIVCKTCTGGTASFQHPGEAEAAWNTRTPKPKTTHYTRWEGGDWHPFVEGEGGRLFGPSGTIHSLRFADGSEWDTVNGWRPNRHITGEP